MLVRITLYHTCFILLILKEANTKCLRKPNNALITSTGDFISTFTSSLVDCENRCDKEVYMYICIT